MDIWTGLGRFALIETVDLWLRPFRFEDSEDFFAMVGQADQLDFIFPARATREESDVFLVHAFMKSPLGVWAMEDKASGRMIGAIRLENLDWQAKTAEVGYFIHRDFRRKGLTSQALRTVADLALETLGFRSLTILSHEENVASQGVAERAGFRRLRRYKGSDRYSRQIRWYIAFEKRREDYE